ncbi:MAG: PD-(D/E)XK nuclease family protein, partial [Faecalibacterium sp.]|nr:PD-(D/E)XK nuclease family protein [Faecalibacterium sp.]
MLNLVLGVSGSGKTTLLYQQLRQRARAGQRSILLVPEQFTSSTEARIYRTLGDAYSSMVESFSFTSLAERILQSCGGAAVRTLTDPGRVVLVRRALDELGGNVKYYYRHRRSAAFCQLAAETITELKSAGLNGQQLGRLALQCGAGSEKLAELALIFQSYEALLAQTGIDPSDRLELAANRLDEALSAGQLPEFLRDRALFVDEFDTFNAPKKRLMGALMRTLPQVTVALCADSGQLTPGELGLFSGAKTVALELHRLARENGAAVAKPTVLTTDLRHRGAPGLAALGQLLAFGDCDQQQAPEITMYEAPNREEEARAAAAAVRRLMRQGVPCGKMAVVCRDLETYRAAVRYEFRLANIPLYCDEPLNPAFSAPAAAVRALLGLCRGMDWCDNMTALAKTGLCSLTEQQVCALENYAYTWAPGMAAWHEEFNKNPQGFGEASRVTEEEKENLKLAEQARAFLIAPVDKLRTAVKGANAEQFSRALYLCLTALGAEQCQKQQMAALKQSRGIPAAEEAAREWNVTMDLLDQMARLLWGEPVSAEEYADLFALLLRSCDLGQIPQTLDAVLFASAGKMRLNEPDYVFVLGLAEGEFPRAPGDTGLLTHADRDALMAQDVQLPDCFENRMVREQVAFYKALTAPAKGLWLSWPAGIGVPRTAQLEPVQQLLHPAAPQLDIRDAAATPAAALDALGSMWGLKGGETASLYAALQQSGGDAAQKLAVLRRMEEMPPKQVKDTAAMARLLGDRLSISPSQLEKYYLCRYGYFLQYVLGLRPRRKAKLSADQSGTLMHWVLQQALEINPEKDAYAHWKPVPFAQMKDAQLAELAHKLVQEYAALYLPEHTTRFGYLLSRIEKSMAALLCWLRDEQQQSQFEPVACEQRIGRGEDALPPQVYQLGDGRTVQVIGTIDRTDRWVDENGTPWVRVVDYKTGTKAFDLREVYCGLDCQMLLYLFSLTRDETG